MRGQQVGEYGTHDKGAQDNEWFINKGTEFMTRFRLTTDVVYDTNRLSTRRKNTLPKSTDGPLCTTAGPHSV